MQPCLCGDILLDKIIIIIIKNECHSNIIVDRLQGCGKCIIGYGLASQLLGKVLESSADKLG